jgi:hypothetical protein
VHDLPEELFAIIDPLDNSGTDAPYEMNWLSLQYINKVQFFLTVMYLN